MKHQRFDHLNYDELLNIVVDPQDLAKERRSHFEQCPQCRQAARRLEQRYTRLGRLARRMAPEPAYGFRAPQKARPVSRWQSRSALALGLAGAMILFVTVWWAPRFDLSQQTQQTVAVSTEQEMELMQQVDALVTDALPYKLQQLVSATESNTSEDLIEWVLPSIDEKEAVDPRAAPKSTGAGPMVLYLGKRESVC
jgi:hypothetical protein